MFITVRVDSRYNFGTTQEYDMFNNLNVERFYWLYLYQCCVNPKFSVFTKWCEKFYCEGCMSPIVLY